MSQPDSGRLLTQQELGRLRDICMDPMRELNSGWRPEHMQCIRPLPWVTNTTTTVFKFPTDEAAFIWNKRFEDDIRLTGHIVTASVTVLVTIYTSGTAGVVAGTVAAIAKDEIQARIPYPKVSRGWTCEASFKNIYKQSYTLPNLGGFGLSWTYITRDHTGREQDKITHGPFWTDVVGEYGEHGMPESMVRRIMSKPSTRREVVFGRDPSPAHGN